MRGKVLNPPVSSEAANVSPLLKSFGVSDLSMGYAAEDDKEVGGRERRKGGGDKGGGGGVREGGREKRDGRD